MARIREALWKVDSAHAPRADMTPSPCPAVAATEQPVEETEVHFIEVGGPHKLVEGSPSVMAVSAAAQKVAVPRQAERKAESAVIATVESAKAATAPGVSFQPLSRFEPSLAPAVERFARELVSFHDPDDPLSEQYRGLVRDLAGHASGAKAHALLIAPVTARNEPAATVLNIAITKVKEGMVSVAVVDADFYQATAAKLLGLPIGSGLREVLSGSLSLQRAIQETGLTGLHLLGAGKGLEDEEGLISGEAMRAVLRHLRMRFGWILINAPVWDGRPGLVTLASTCDAAYLVLSETEAKEARIQELLRTIPRQGVPLRGCIYTRQ